jgi:hypothetical protein
MRTRTLLLLAIGCGLVILLAGGIQLLRLGRQEQTVRQLGVGEIGQAGDVNVALISSSAAATQLVAVVRVGGVSDADGLEGFTLVAPGRVLAVSSSTCEGIAVRQQDCELTFNTIDVPGTSRQLIFRRADQQLRWVLAQGA